MSHLHVSSSSSSSSSLLLLPLRSRPPSSAAGIPMARATPRSASSASATPPPPPPPPPPPSPSPKALAAVNKSKIIACLRAQDGDVAMRAATAALEGGISALEIVMSTPGVLEVIRGLVKNYPSSVIGAGTVLSAEDARKAVEAGAQFLMSPCMVMEILHDLRNTEVLYIPGAMTPTEVLFAYNNGARIVKIYPVSILGGESYISTLKKPFPHIPLVASQGIMTDSIGGYIKGGASAVILSDAIFEKEAMRQRNFTKIHQLAQLATLEVYHAVE